MTTGWRQVARRIRVPMGFLFTAYFLWAAHPSYRSLLLSLALVLPGLCLRAYASGYVKKNAALTVTGPYAYTRNPLYLGSIAMACGFVLASRNVYLAGCLVLLLAAIYVPTILSEEDFLRATFPEFAEYARRVPRLLPRLTPARLGDVRTGGFSAALYRKHREYRAALGCAAIYAALVVLLLFGHL